MRDGGGGREPGGASRGAGSGKREAQAGSTYVGSAPPELEVSMSSALDGNSSPTASDLLEAAERLLDRVLQSDCESRSSALDLLTVDALLTHALQVDAADSDANSGFADVAMARLASHGRI
jgi:hypothetical protein